MEIDVMSTNPCLQAVVIAPSYKGKPLWPWSVANYKPFSHIQLYSEMTDFEVGLIFAQLVDYNGLNSGGNATSKFDECFAISPKWSNK